MTQFRKRPIIVEAFRFRHEDFPDWLHDRLRVYGAPLAGDVMDLGDFLEIHTLEGIMRGEPGDWIIKGVKDELYPIKDEIFRKTYEPADAA